jgi:hypothetical protein
VEHRVHPRSFLSLAAALAVALAVAGCDSLVAWARPPDRATSGTSGAAESPPLPPDAVLVLPNGRRIAGVIGSYEFNGTAADVPWLPASSLTQTVVLADSPLAVSFADGSAIGGWTASRAPSADAQGLTSFGVGGREASEPPLLQVQVSGIRPGDWVLAVRLFLADGSGDATYFWSIAARRS